MHDAASFRCLTGRQTAACVTALELLGRLLLRDSDWRRRLASLLVEDYSGAGMACRAAWQTSSADPSLPVGAAICFSIYKLFDKRKKRAPEGDTSGRSHIWGAVAVTVFGLVLGSLVRLCSWFSGKRFL